MNRRTTVLVGTFALGLAVQAAAAQEPVRAVTGALVGVPRKPTPGVRTTKPRLAGIAPAPPIIPSQNGVPTTGFINTGVPQVAAFYYLPTIVLVDGRVYGNFNGRYEQVLRRCPVTSGQLPPGFATPACWVVDGNGRYQVIQQR